MSDDRRPKGTAGSSEDDEAAERRQTAARLREAREFLNLTQGEVAAALGLPRTSVNALEQAKRNVTSTELRRFAGLYRRPIEWLLGVDETAPPALDALYRATQTLSPADKEQVLRFAEFLAAAGTPPRRRATTPEPASFADPVIDPGPDG